VTSRYDEKVSQFRALAAEANQIFQNSAADTSGSRALRFVHDPVEPGQEFCEPTVLEVEVSSNGDDSYSSFHRPAGRPPRAEKALRYAGATAGRVNEGRGFAGATSPN
jgi:hypothetical protein